MSETRHGMEKIFQNIFIIILYNNFTYDQLVVKTKFKGLKRQLSSKITEERLNDVIYPTLGMVCTIFFSEYSSYYIQQL